MGRTSQSARKSTGGKGPRTAVTSSKGKAPRSGAKKVPRKHFSKLPSGPAPIGTIKKPHRWRAGTVALREIRKYQMTASTLVPKAPLVRLIREIAQDYGAWGEGWRFQQAAIDAIHTAVESELTSQFQATNLGAIHARRVTIFPKDMLHARAMHSVLPGRPVNRVDVTRMFWDAPSLVKKHKKASHGKKKHTKEVMAKERKEAEAEEQEQEEEEAADEEPLNMALLQGDD